MSIFWNQRMKKARKQYNYTNLQRAFNATLTGMSVYHAARQFGVPESTLRDRTRGHVSIDAKPGPESIFSDNEEHQLVDHLKYMADIGYGYTKANVQYLAADYAVSCGKKDPSERPLSDCWFYGFMCRWPDLKLAKPQKLSIMRAKCASRDVLNRYYKELSTILTVNNLRERPDKIFNIDETGINTEHSPPRVVCCKDTQAQAVSSTRSQNVTIIGCGNALGNHIPPYFVFPGKKWNSQLLDGAPPRSFGEMSDSGWSNSTIFHNYITKHFAKHSGISDGNNSQPTLILYDGHKSHISLTLLHWANKNNVILFVLPPHTSHITQPLDTGIFGPFKSMYNSECQLFLQKNPGQQVTRYDIAKLICQPYLKAMSPENLISAFDKSGIYPFSNKKILDSQLAPSTIYHVENDASHGEEQITETPQAATQDYDKDVVMNAKTSEKDEGIHDFFKKRKIIQIAPKPKRKFVTPFLTGSLAKKKNVNIMQHSSASKPYKEAPIVQDNSTSFTVRKSSVSTVKSASTELMNIRRVPTFSKKSCTTSKKVLKTSPMITIPSSPQPGPSAYYVDDEYENIFEDSQDSLSVSEDESSHCCVCHKHQPPALKGCVNLVIVKWAQCDNCQHWTHLSFCYATSVIRRHSSFLCPHCV